MNKKSLSERDICTKFISPAVQRAGWETQSQVREEVHFTQGRINVRGKMVSRGKDKFADHSPQDASHLSGYPFFKFPS